MSEKKMLERIRAAEEAIAQNREAVRQSRYRQKYHFMPEVGWMNDPNGLIFFQGKYHFFYQFYPYSGFWGSMHWGHAISEDMLHWQYEPVALAPSEFYDDHEKGGCFSGSAIAYQGKLYLMYTGTANNGNGFEQTQNIAISEDGVHFKKFEGNPVLKAPSGIPGNFFRDPKVWEHDGIFYMVCGASRDGKAQALLYRSENMTNWEFLNVLAESRGEWGTMFECPDFFELNGKYVLVVSPMGCGERTSVYMVGDFDYQTGKFFPSVSGEIDWGYQYYAPASFLASDGRRIMVAWANAWDWMPFWKDWGPTYRDGWCGSFNIPREVHMNTDGTLSFYPIRELEALRKDEKAVTGEKVEEGDSFPLPDGFCYEIEAEIDLEKTSAKQVVFCLRRSDNQETNIIYDLKKGEVRFDLNQADHWSRGTARAPLNLVGKNKLLVRIFSDRSSVEVFSNEYRTNLSCNVYTTAEAERNTVMAVGGCLSLASLRSWQLESIQ